MVSNVNAKVSLNKYLLAGQNITERSHYFSGQEVEDQSEGDADWQRWQSLLEESQEDQSETKSNQDGNEAC